MLVVFMRFEIGRERDEPVLRVTGLATTHRARNNAGRRVIGNIFKCSGVCEVQVADDSYKT